MAFRFVIGYFKDTPYLPGSIFCIVESFQILYIAIKFANPDAHSNWTWVLMFYYVITVILFIIAVVLMVFLVVFFFSFFFNSRLFREVSNLSKFLITGLIFYFTWTGIAFYHILSGFDILLETKVIAIKPSNAKPDTRLYSTAWFVLVCSLITLVLMALAYHYLKDAMLHFFNKEKIKEISLQSFVTNLKLDIEKTDSQFTSEIRKFNQTFGLANSKDNHEKCLVCKVNQPDVLFHPCRHGRICQDCLRQYLREKDKCPHCREKIDKAYLIVYDEKNNCYMARGYIQVKYVKNK